MRRSAPRLSMRGFQMSRHQVESLGAAAGMIGPALLAIVVLSLTIVQYPFMRSLGWDPVSRPTFDWPSGLALGPVGWIMTITFLASGAALSLFGWGLRMVLRSTIGQISTILFIWSGV